MNSINRIQFSYPSFGNGISDKKKEEQEIENNLKDQIDNFLKAKALEESAPVDDGVPERLRKEVLEWLKTRPKRTTYDSFERSGKQTVTIERTSGGRSKK